MTFKDVFSMLIDSFLIAMLLVLISMIVCYFYKKYQKQKLTYPIRIACFLLYLYMLIYVTVFRGGLFQNDIHSINITPFDELLLSSYYQLTVLGKKSAVMMFSYNVFGNILWFIPLGLFLPTFLKKLSLKKVVLMVFLTSFTIEVLQYIFYTGVSDIDDIIFNMVGGIIGYYIYKNYDLKNKEKNE